MEYASIDLAALVACDALRTGGANDDAPTSTTSLLAAAFDRFLDGKSAAGYKYREESRALGAIRPPSDTDRSCPMIP